MALNKNTRIAVQASILSLATWQLSRQLGLDGSSTKRLMVGLPATHVAVCALTQDVRRDPWLLPAKPLKKTACVLGKSVLLLCVLHGASSLLRRMTQGPRSQLPVQNAVVYLKWAMQQGGAVRAQALLRICVFGPMAEEVVFRGFLQEDLERLSDCSCGSLVLASVAFGALHYSVHQGLSNLDIVVGTSLIGLYLGRVHNEGGTFSAVALHMIHNSLVTARLLTL